MKKKIVIVLILMCVLFAGCEKIPPEVVTTNKILLRVSKASLIDQQKSNDSVIILVSKLLLDKVMKEKENTWKKLIEIKDGTEYISIEALNRFNAKTDEKFNKIRAQIAEVKRRLDSNTVNSKLKIDLLERLIKIEEKYNEKAKATNVVLDNLDSILDIYEKFKKGDKDDE